jgi:hypothetical protein
MKYKIFQICFEQDQILQCDSLFTPFDNIDNQYPELREFHSFNRIIDEGFVDDLDAWGVFGPRWQGKMRHSSNLIFDKINNNPGMDVWIFNHARVISALTYNVWEHGELVHKGISKVTKTALSNAGYSTDVFDMAMADNICYSSYFVATKEFWMEYIKFLKIVKHQLDSLTGDIKNIYLGSANYSRDKSLSFFPFIVERLFSTFLTMNNYRVYNSPYDYSLYSKELGSLEEVILALNNLKKLSIKFDSIELIEQWNSIRRFMLKTEPKLFDID